MNSIQEQALPEAHRIEKLNWFVVDQRLKSDTRIVIPLGATEEHGYLSLLTDTLFVTYVTDKACEKAGVLMAPALPFGCSAFAINFPGTISLKTETMCRIVEDIVDSLYRQGFRRIIFVTGHGGNEVITGALAEVQIDRPQLNVYYEDAWAGMKGAIRRVEKDLGIPKTEHGAWHEAFPFTTITGEIPTDQRGFPCDPDFPEFPINPRTARKYLQDGVVSGKYAIQDEALMEELLQSCVDTLTEFLLTVPRMPAAS